MGRNIGKNISKKLSVKYGQKLLDNAKRSATDALKTVSKREIQKAAEATGDFIDNKVADKITKVSKTSSQNSEEKNIGHVREISSEKRQQIINGNNIIMAYQK